MGEGKIKKEVTLVQPVGFEPTPPKRLRPERSALDHSAKTACCLAAGEKQREEKQKKRATDRERESKKNNTFLHDTYGIRTRAGIAQWLSRPPP